MQDNVLRDERRGLASISSWPTFLTSVGVQSGENNSVEGANFLRNHR